MAEACGGAAAFKFTPLYGVMGRDPLSYVLQVGEVNILLDCGWEETFDAAIIEPLKEWAPKIHLVLISHCDMEHLGALPYAVGKLGLQAPVYATLPVQKMGSLLMYDQCLSRQDEGEWDLFDLDNVDAVFSAMKSLRFSQIKRLEGKCDGLMISPLCAGHTLGGAIWKISAHGEEIAYAVDYNHRRERHLNGTNLESAFSRPSLLITDAFSFSSGVVDRKARDKDLADTIISTCRGDGNVLLPVDSAGRVIELLLYLESFWAEKRLVYPLVFLNRQAYNTIEFAKSQLEWMSDVLARRFERSRDHPNPFDTRYLQLCHSTSELSRLPPGPMVVLATVSSLETGLSRELFASWASVANNTVIFTETAQRGTLASQVQSHKGSSKLSLHMKLSKTVPLEGEELEAYLAEVERKKQEEREAEAETEVAMEQQPMTRSAAVVSHTMLRSVSLKNQPSISKQQVLQLEDGDADEDVLVDFRKGAPPEDAAAPMFPDEDSPPTEWDEFGCTVDESLMKLREVAFGTTAGDVTMADQEEELEQHPTKIQSTQVDIVVNCRVHTLDYEGRTDGRSMRTIVGHVAPRQLVLVHAPQEDTDRMLKYCVAELQGRKSVCRAPSALETIDVSPSYQTLEVQLGKSLLPGLDFRDIAGSSFAWVNGKIALMGEGQLPLLNKAGTSSGGPGTVFIGDARLSAVKQALAEAGVQAEFNGGVLVCAGQITVRRGTAEGQLLMEGALCEEYYRVRDVVYGQYHIC